MDWQNLTATKAFWTADEVRDQSPDSGIRLTEGEDAQGNPIDRAAIPRHEVYPVMLGQKWEEAIDLYGSTLFMGGDQWKADMSDQAAGRVNNEMQRAGKQAIAYELEQGKARITRSQDVGDFEGAKQQINALFRNPAVKQAALDENLIRGRRHEVDLGIVQARSVDDFDDLLGGMTPEWADGLPSDEYLKLLTQVSTAKAAGMKQAKVLETERQDQTLLEVLQRVPSGAVTVADIDDLAQQLGTANYTKALNHLQDQTNLIQTSSNPHIANGIQGRIARFTAGLSDELTAPEDTFSGYRTEAQTIRRNILGYIASGDLSHDAGNTLLGQ